MFVRPSWWLNLLRGSRVLEQPLRFNHIERPGSFAARFSSRLTHFRPSYGVFRILPAFLASVIVVVCRNVFRTGTMYTSWFVAAAACRVCEFVVVEASVDSSHPDVVPGVAVVASEGYAVCVVVSRVCLVAEGDIMGPRPTLSRVLRAVSIRDGSASIFLLT